jgi:hypothetical protein
MLGELEPFDYVLAERLHCTVEEMCNRVSNLEYHRWRAFYEYRQAMQDLELQEMTRGKK